MQAPPGLPSIRAPPSAAKSALSSWGPAPFRATSHPAPGFGVQGLVRQMHLRPWTAWAPTLGRSGWRSRPPGAGGVPFPGQAGETEAGGVFLVEHFTSGRTAESALTRAGGGEGRLAPFPLQPHGLREARAASPARCPPVPGAGAGAGAGEAAATSAPSGAPEAAERRPVHVEPLVNGKQNSRAWSLDPTGNGSVSMAQPCRTLQSFAPMD